jgi:hypothetical protein
MGNLRDKYTNEEWEEIGERIRDAKNKPEPKTITYTEKDFKEMVNGWNEEREALEKENEEVKEWNQKLLKLNLLGTKAITDLVAQIEKLRLKIKELEGK